MKKYLLVMFALVALSGCGKDGTNGSNGAAGADGQNAASDASISNAWTAQDPASPIASLDLSLTSLNVQLPATFLGCDTSGPDQSGVDTPVGFFQVHKGNVFINGSSTYGIIQFGQQPHSSHSGLCYTVGQEAYNYSISGNEMTLCDIKYGVCSVFQKN